MDKNENEWDVSLISQDLQDCLDKQLAFRQSLDAEAARVDQQQAEIERLRAALEPFAVMFDEFRSTEGVSEIYQYNGAILRYSDFERARRALESKAAAQRRDGGEA